MPHSEFDFSSMSATVITASNRVLAGRDNVAAQVCNDHLDFFAEVSSLVVPEEFSAIDDAIASALASGSRFIIVCGASGFGLGNEAPEAVRNRIAIEIPGIAEQIRAHGSHSTPLAALSREVVGVTGRGPGSALVLSSPGSRSGVRDTLEVLLPLLSPIFSQLDEER